MPPKTRFITCEICGNRASRMRDEKRLFMAKFPVDENRCRRWVKAVGKEDLVYVPIEKLHTLKYVCGNHFENKAFNRKKSRLKKHAVPSKNLIADPLSDEMLLEFPCHILSDIDFTMDNATQRIHDNEHSLSQVEAIAEPSNSEPYMPEQQLTAQGVNNKKIHQSRNEKWSPTLESSVLRHPLLLDHDYCITKENMLQWPKRKKVSGLDVEVTPKTRFITCEVCGNRASRMRDEKRMFMAKFPIDENRCRRWVKAVGKEDLVYVPIEKLHALKYVCGNHFENKAFNRKKSRLKKHAVPSKNLRADPLSDEMLLEFPCHILSDIDFTMDNATQRIHDNEHSLSQVEAIAGPSNSEPYMPEQQLSAQGVNDKKIHQSRNEKWSLTLESSVLQHPLLLDHDYCITTEYMLQSP